MEMSQFQFILLNALNIFNVNSFSTACDVENINSMHIVNLFIFDRRKENMIFIKGAFVNEILMTFVVLWYNYTD